MIRLRLAPALLAAAAAALPACVSTEGTPGFAVGEERWNAGLTNRGLSPSDAPNPMATTPAMLAAARDIAGTGRDEVKLEHLRAALMDDRGSFTFEYERNSTFSAGDAFEKRRGNCVSYTNLFIAMGRSLGIRLHAALGSTRGTSERQGDLIVTYNHMVAVYMEVNGRNAKVYDFYRTDEQLKGRLSLLDDYSVAAIRASNDGIAHLGRDEGPEAVHDLEIAVKLAPRLASLYANLGLAQWRSGDVPGAFATLRKGLEIEPDCPPLLQNLAALYVENGKTAEARAALGALDLRRASPYALIVRGDLELRGGNAKAAIRNYREAAALDATLADPWLAIARAELSLGRPEAARKAAAKALKRDPASEEARRLLALEP
jgi:tetratricopeptide (TPR) repeat protein